MSDRYPKDWLKRTLSRARNIVNVPKKEGKVSKVSVSKELGERKIREIRASFVAGYKHYLLNDRGFYPDKALPHFQAGWETACEDETFSVTSSPSIDDAFKCADLYIEDLIRRGGLEQ